MCAAGNQTSVQDANGFFTTSVYSANSERLAATVNALGYYTTLVYDLAGQNTGRQNPLGNWISMTYDLAGRQLAIFNELGYATTNAYDLNGRTVSIIDAMTRVKTMSYDPASNPTGTAYFDGTILTYQYDPVNRVTTMSDWTGVTTYAFDPRSLLVGKTDPGTLVQIYAYDANSNRTLLVDPDGGRYTTTYDPLDRASVLTDSASRVFTGQYDADGRNTTVLAGNSGQTLRAFDPIGRVITLIGATASGTPVMTVIDSYDPGGRKNLTAKNGVVTTYSNDATNRLLGQAVLNGCSTFSYDPVGNVLLKWNQGQAPQTMTYDAASRLVTQLFGASTTLYTYNQAGGMSSESNAGAVTSYTYDGENRMLMMTNPMLQVTTNVYSGDGHRRSWQAYGGPINTQIWDGSNYLGEIQ